MQGLIGTLLAALSPFPEARQAAAQALIEGGWASNPDTPPQPLTPLSAAEQPAEAGPLGCAEAHEMDNGPETVLNRSAAGCAAEAVREGCARSSLPAREGQPGAEQTGPGSRRTR
jgi:hypothetical protein